jgi:hypothetical protein
MFKEHQMTECCCANTKVVSVDDYNAVLEAAHNYVEGLRTGDADTVAKAFHKEAIMYGLAGGKTLLGGPIGNLYDFVRRNGSAPEIKTHMDVLAITPTTAVVRIDMEKDAIGADYNDYITFIKLDGRWQAIAKVFHQFNC